VTDAQAARATASGGQSEEAYALLDARVGQATFNAEIARLQYEALQNSDPAQIAAAADAWVEALTHQAHFLPGEFAHEALWSYYARDYVTQVTAGGHEQYFANRGADEIALTRSYPSSLVQPSVFNHISPVGEQLGAAGGRLLASKRGK